MKYKGVIIEESLRDKTVLNSAKIISTKVEKVSNRHQTPWLSKWTLHNIEVTANNAEQFAKQLSKSFDYSNGTSWYADFNNGDNFFVIYKDKIFSWTKEDQLGAKKAQDYGLSLGIPEYQVDFPTR